MKPLHGKSLLPYGSRAYQTLVLLSMFLLSACREAPPKTERLFWSAVEREAEDVAYVLEPAGQQPPLTYPWQQAPNVKKGKLSKAATEKKGK